MKIIKVLFSLVLMIFVQQIFAQYVNNYQQPYRHQGFYGEINGGTVWAEETLPWSDSTASSLGGAGINGNLGYQFGRFFAMEGGYSYLKPTGGISGINLYDLALKGIVPVTDRFNLFVKLGGASGHVAGEGSGDGLYGGAGASVGLMPQLFFTVQGSGMTDGWATIGLLSGGLTYYF